MTKYERNMRTAIERHTAADALRLFPLFFDTVDSTNRLCKQLATQGAEEGTVLFAETQTGGHGRFARPFYSPRDGGLYMSLLLRPTLSPDRVTDITTAAAVAVAEAVEMLSGRPAGIKWVNDVYMDGRKVCGILTEGGVDAHGRMAYAVLGIGVNVIAPDGGFPEEISGVAGAVLPQGSPEEAVFTLAADILARFLGYYAHLLERPHAAAYRARSVLDGKRVRVHRGTAAAEKTGDGETATVLGLDESLCPILCYDDGRCEHLCSGEVSLSGI